MADRREASDHKETAESVPAIRFGAMEGILRRSGGELVKVARQIGFDGVELNLREADPLQPYLTDAGQRVLRQACERFEVAIPSLCLAALSGDGLCLKRPENHEPAAEFIGRGMAAAVVLGARVLLLPFFGRGELFDRGEMKQVAEGLRRVARDAEQAGLTLALENSLGARDNLWILEQVGSPAVGIYFDVSNAMWWGLNSPDEIRAYGNAGVLSQIHFKDGKGDHSNAMLGEGHVDFAACVSAIREVGYTGWIVLESAAPHDPVADAKTNLGFARALVAGG
jgi:sugar phosphate isomerase/epimerase